MESERGSLEPGVSCSAHKLPEMWNGIDHPIEEMDLKLLEEKGMVTQGRSASK